MERQQAKPIAAKPLTEEEQYDEYEEYETAATQQMQALKVEQQPTSLIDQDIDDLENYMKAQFRQCYRALPWQGLICAVFFAMGWMVFFNLQSQSPWLTGLSIVGVFASPYVAFRLIRNVLHMRDLRKHNNLGTNRQMQIANGSIIAVILFNPAVWFFLLALKMAFTGEIPWIRDFSDI